MAVVENQITITIPSVILMRVFLLNLHPA